MTVLVLVEPSSERVGLLAGVKRVGGREGWRDEGGMWEGMGIFDPFFNNTRLQIPISHANFAPKYLGIVL